MNVSRVPIGYLRSGVCVPFHPPKQEGQSEWGMAKADSVY